jgi:polysaccharide chain length determinant protein (PEP-CTERM system associated)
MLGHRALNVEDYLAILKRHWWLIAIPAFIMPVLAVIATLYIPPQYVSQTLVLIDQQKVPENFVPSVVTEDINSRLASMKEQILSRSSIQPIIEKFNLYADQRLSMDDRITLARKSIDIQPITSEIARSNGLPGFKIFFTANDAHTAQEVCAEITTLFTGANLRSRSEAAEGTTDFLKEQLDSAKRTLDDQDAKLAAFQREHFGMLPEDEANNINLLSTLNTQLDASTQALSRMEQDKSYMETMLAQQAASSPSAASPQSDDKELQDLLAQQANLTSRYSANYPDVISVNRKIADLRRKMAQSPSAPSSIAAPGRNDSAAAQDLRARIRAADIGIQAKRAEQAQLNKQIRSYQGRIQSSPQVEAEFKELTRDTQTSQALYDSDLTKLNQSQMATDLEHRQEGETFSLLDEANLPDSPTYPKRRVFASGGLGAGLILGLLLTALLEYRDTALRSERDVWAFTKLPTLAVIAWSGDVADRKPGKFARLKRLFRRKPPVDATQPMLRSPKPTDNHV